MNEPTTILSDRYIIEAELGIGGMGTVYRAVDRLTQNVVALKRIQWFLADEALAQNLQVALGREFQILASLRHPHIISVLDYGFDAEQTPYFSMEFLPEAQDLLQASASSSLPQKTRYIIAILQALHYLHRRGVLHLDLKPGNILVSGGRLRVLDFGLAMVEARAGARAPRSGTLFYMAPEVLRGKAVGPATDLYAVGVLLYEVLTGQLPLTGNGSLSQLVREILNVAPDLGGLDDEPALQAIVRRLLAKDPDERYPGALDVIHALNATLSQGVLVETQEIRESFLQASTFVGRKAELAQLTDALTQAMSGQGSAWLVGGESGVGKSRLLDELRVQAMVRGALVLQGQGVAGGGGLPFQLWREPLRRLVLGADLDDLTASVLLPLVPDIARLLEREVRPAPELEAEAGQQRLLSAIGQLSARQQRPVLLILEDLQWTSESLLVLRQLNRFVAHIPVLVVGSYQDDERPGLPGELPGMHVLKLERLSGAEMAELSVSMLGQDGQRPDVLDLLQRETEGNAFFLVEVVRALAERAGRLGAIGLVELPDRVFAGGVQAVIQHRLQRVPMEAQFLLTLAAAFGRQLDLRVLAQLAPDTDLERWLLTCANAAVLHVRDDVWRFAHEKLREGVLSALPPGARVVLHRQVAQAVERVYPGDPDQAATLVYYWRIAGDSDEEKRQARIAGEYALARHTHDEAVTHLTRALELTSATDLLERYELLRLREQAFDLQGKRDAQAADLAALALVASALNNFHWQARVALRQAEYAINIDDYQGAIAAAQQAIALGQKTQSTELLAEGELVWGNALKRQGQYAAAQAQYERALPVLRQMGMRRQVAEGLTALGTVLSRQAEYASARSKFQQALQVSREIDDRQTQGGILNQLGILTAWHQADYTLARSYFQDALHIYRGIGLRRGEAVIWNNLGAIARHLGEYDSAKAYSQQALAIYREIDNREGVGLILGNLGLTWHLLGDRSQAQTYLRQALRIMQEIGNQPVEGMVLHYLGGISIDLGEFAQAENDLQQALNIQREIGHRQIEGLTLGNLGWLAYARGDYAQADAYYGQARALNQEIGQPLVMISAIAGLARSALAQDDLAGAQARVDEILAYMETNPTLEGLDFSFRVFLTCIQVLQAAQDPRAGEFLASAHALLQERAAKIADDDLRRSFLENVAEHQEIGRAYERVFGAGGLS